MRHIGLRRWNRPLVVIVAALAGGLIGMGIDHLAFAQQPGITRTILLRTDDPASPSYEAVVGVAEIPPGASSGKHRHYGTEVGYVLQGTLVVEHAGADAMTITAGQAFKNEGGVHNARNPGKTPTKILAVYIVEKGKPLAEPVP
jgi:quercetin dioxygenase-like cupin family protein